MAIVPMPGLARAPPRSSPALLAASSGVLARPGWRCVVRDRKCGIVRTAAPSAASRLPLTAAPAPAASSVPLEASLSPARGCYPASWPEHSLTPHQYRQLGDFLDYLLEINKSMNLTAIRDKDEAWERHIGDSLALLPAIETHLQPTLQRTGVNARSSSSSSSGGSSSSSSSLSGLHSPASPDGHSSAAPVPPVTPPGSPSAAAQQPADRAREAEVGAGGIAADSSGGSGGGVSASDDGSARPPLRVIDVGTGAGLPGMVFAVARPLWKVTLLDSLRKRCDFLREAAKRIGLTNVDVVWSRAEDAGQDVRHRQAYGLAVARAVAETRVLAELCLPFVAVGGLWVAAKGPDPEAEVASASNALRQLGGRLLAVERVSSFSVDGQRTALAVRKVAPTPASLPRQAGTPNKKPL